MDQPGTREGKKLRVFSITSGKGGVGKSLLTVHLACTLRDMGNKVLVIDGNFGNGNIDIMFGVPSEKTIFDVLTGTQPLKDILVNAIPGVTIIPAGSGIFEISSPETNHKLSLLSELDTVDKIADVVIIDTPPGITSNVMFLNTSATEIILVTTPEITSIINTISSIKVLHNTFGEKEFKLIVNMAEDEYDADSTFRLIEEEAERFFGVRLNYCGYCPLDGKLRVFANFNQPPEECEAGEKRLEKINVIARKILQSPPEDKPKKGHQFFARRILEEDHREKVCLNVK